MKLNLMMTTLLVAASVTAAETKVTFDESVDLPKGWQTGITGQGQAKCEVVADDSAPSKPNVLKQSGEATFAWAAKTDERIKPLRVLVWVNWGRFEATKRVRSSRGAGCEPPARAPLRPKVRLTCRALGHAWF